MVDQFTLSGKVCLQKDPEDCWVRFKLNQLVGKDNYTAEIQIKKGTEPEPVRTSLLPSDQVLDQWNRHTFDPQGSNGLHVPCMFCLRCVSARQIVPFDC